MEKLDFISELVKQTGISSEDGEKVNQSSYYSRRYYKGYYHKYDTNRNRT